MSNLRVSIIYTLYLVDYYAMWDLNLEWKISVIIYMIEWWELNCRNLQQWWHIVNLGRFEYW